MEIKQFKEENFLPYWNTYPLEGYIYSNVFDEKFFQGLKNLVVNIFEKSSTNTFLTHNTQFNFEGQTKKIVSHSVNDRRQHVMFDLSFDKEWHYQTPESIKQWSEKKFENISPYFLKVIKTFENSEPMVNEKNKWLCFRLHFNVLEYQEFFTMHTDTLSAIYNTPSLNEARSWSITFYLHDHIEGYGGELYSISGFVYKPQKNSAICINGNKAIHGVNQNMNPEKKVRLAFTMRFAHIDDLLLPGHPDKFLYQIVTE
jgi:hypothetical protein